MRKVILLASIMFLTAVNAFGYSGDCVIWGQPNGQYIPTPYSGDSTGFGRARDACIRRGGGVITVGPGCGAVTTTYPNGANILVIKTFGSGWVADPFSLSSTTFANLRIARLGPTSSAGSGGAIRIVEGSTFAISGAGIQAAHDDLPAAGGLILVPADAINYTSTINITKNNVTIQGSGRGSQLINSTAPGVDAFNISASNVTIMNLRINGNKASTTVGEGFHITGSNVTIKDCFVENTPDYGIHFHTGSSGGLATGNTVISAGLNGVTTEGAAIVVHDGSDYRIIGNQVNDPNTYGVYVQGAARKVVIEGNTIKDANQDGILADSLGKYITIVGNNIQDSDHHGITANADSSLVADNVVSRSGVSDNAAFGIWANGGCRGCSWWGNHVIDSEGYGIAWHPDGLAQSQSAGLSIFSNFILNGNGFGIDILGAGFCGINDVMIGNNYIIGTGQNQAGIRVQTNALSNGINRVHIVGNVVKNSVDDGIEINSIGTRGIQDLVITENHIVNNVDDAIVLNNAGVASTAFISDNMTKGNGQNTIDVGSNWNIQTFDERRIIGSSAVIEDSLRVQGTSEGATSLDVSLGGLTLGNGNLALNSGKAVISDSLRVGTYAVITDSLRVGRSPEFGYREGGSVDDTLRIGRRTVLKKYGSAGDVFFPNTGNILEFDNDGANIIRASDPNGTLSFTSGGTTARMSLATDGTVTINSSKFKNSSSSASIQHHFTGTASLDFDLTAATSQDLTITVTGAVQGDAVILGIPDGAMVAEIGYIAWVFTTDTVKVRAFRVAGTPNPPASTFRASVIHYN